MKKIQEPYSFSLQYSCSAMPTTPVFNPMCFSIVLLQLHLIRELHKQVKLKNAMLLEQKKNLYKQIK